MVRSLGLTGGSEVGAALTARMLAARVTTVGENFIVEKDEVRWELL